MKRHLLSIFVFLIAGAMVTIGVAWLAVTTTDHTRQLWHPVEPSDRDRAVWDRYGPSGPHTESAFIEVSRARTWGLDLKDIEPYYAQGLRLVVLEAGWPLRALRHLEVGHGPRAWVTHGAIDVRVGRTLGLPLVPIWPGFAGNTLAYGAILWLVVRLARSLRRTLRIRRGSCPACGYPVGASPRCSECGEPLPEEPR